MNRHRCVISMPGVFISSTNAVIWFFGLPLTILGGVFAITTITPAFKPFVHQSFSPLRDKGAPVGRGLRLFFLFRRTRPPFLLGERKCIFLSLRNPRKEPPFLLLGPEQDQRLRHTDGLMRRNQRGEITAIASEHH